jgi:multidrug efflux pump subunit AcrA (membrane-fusion protein)
MRRSTWINGAIVVVLIAVVIGTFVVVRSDTQGSTTRDTVVTAKRANVLSTVSATGNVEAEQDLSLSFQQSGEVTSISVQEGDHVVSGQELARVDDTQQKAALASAEASLTSAQASLAATLRGETSAERAQDDAGANAAQQQVTSAQQGLDHANQTASLNATKYRQQVDQSQTALDQANSGQLTAQQNETSAESSLRTLQRSYDPNASSTETASAAVARYQLDQAHCQAHSSDPSWKPSDGIVCSQVGNLLSFATAWQSSETALAQADDAVTTANQTLDQAKQSQTAGVLQDQQSIQNAQAQLDSANASYKSTIAGNNAKQQPAKPEAIAQARASVVSAEQLVASAQKNLDDTVLRAPVAGTVAAVNGTVGQQSSAGANSSSATSSSASSANSSSTSSSGSSSGFITLTDVDSLVVKAGFTETDAPKLRTGQKATITLDALPDKSYVGTVETIDTNQTVVNNVVTYYATVRFDDGHPDGVKPGMTASAAVVLDKRDDAITLSTSAVPSSGETATVTVRANGKEESRTVTIGLRGDNAVEITDGLAAGDQVVVRSTTSSGSGGFTPPGGGLGGGIGGGLGGGAPR